MDLNEFLDLDVDTDGAKWFDDVPDHEGLRLQVRSTNYPPYVAAMKAAGLKHNKAFRNGTGDSIAGRIAAEHLLVSFDATNWVSPLTKSGSIPAYSKENAITLMTKRDKVGVFVAFQNAVFECAQQLAEEQRELAGEAAGN